MTPGMDEFFEELRREYLAEASARLTELRKDLKAGERHVQARNASNPCRCP